MKVFAWIVSVLILFAFSPFVIIGFLYKITQSAFQYGRTEGQELMNYLYDKIDD